MTLSVDVEYLQEFYATGNKESLGKFFTYHFEFIYKIIIYHMRNEADAEDVSQQVFLSLLDRKNPCKAALEGDSANVKSWLAIICTNRCRNFLRKKINKEKLHQKKKIMREEFKNESDGSEMQLQLEEALSNLPVKYRVPVLLRYKDELSFSEIAGILNQKQVTIRSQISRGIAYLRENMSVGKTALSVAFVCQLISQVELKAAPTKALEVCLNMSSDSQAIPLVMGAKSSLMGGVIKVALVTTLSVTAGVFAFQTMNQEVKKEISNIEVKVNKHRYDFSKEDGSDIELRNGSWEHDEANGRMVVEKDVITILPAKYEKPLYMETKVLITSDLRSDWALSFYRANEVKVDKDVKEFIFQPSAWSTKAGDDYIHKAYLIGKYTFVLDQCNGLTGFQVNQAFHSKPIKEIPLLAGFRRVNPYYLEHKVLENEDYQVLIDSINQYVKKDELKNRLLKVIEENRE